MQDDRWTVLLVRGHRDPVRQVSVTHTMLRRAGWVAGVGMLIAVVCAGIFGLGGFGHLQALGLAKQNTALVDELARLQAEVGALEGTIGSLQDREAELRAMAGLDPLDADVLAAGIGGPGSRTPESNPLAEVDADLGGQAFAIDYDIDALQRRARVLLESMSEAGDSLASQRELLMSRPTLFPTAGSLSSGYSKARMHPILNEILPHPGVDIAAPAGTPILAAGKGRVTRAGWVTGYGQTVEIDHGNGFTTLYAHASKLLVRSGQEVERGDVIAQVGRTGTATSTHLHYEVRQNGRQQNPLNFFLPGTFN
ncbi:peptidoglycan DD-metalloendopeptidase family protein [Gaopeijia maritima]|uniref:M23 family metallopeptidase n=1 Tax=Gaopeijia maritima TaxID=3119007 RepID=A0ABU9EB01_9BACT